MLDLTPLDYFPWGYLKDQMYNWRVNAQDELKARITAVIENVTKDMLQMALIVKRLARKNFPLVCKNKLF
jgi:hypothetical protein